MANKSAFAARIGNRLRELRGSRSYAEIEQATGGAISARLVQYYEAGTEPRFGTMLVLLAALGVTPEGFAPDLAGAVRRRQPAEAAAIVFGDVKARRSAIKNEAKYEAGPDVNASELAEDLGIL